MDLVIYEENRPLVLQALENGDFDYIEAAGEVFETDFFRYIQATKILAKLAETYPTNKASSSETPPISSYRTIPTTRARSNSSSTKTLTRSQGKMSRR